MDESNDVPTLDFPFLPTPPGFHQNYMAGRHSGTGWFIFAARLEPPGWYPVTHPVDVRDGPTLSPGVSPGVSDMSSSSSVVSDESDGDAWLLSALPGPPSFRLAQHKVKGHRSRLLPVPWTLRLIVFRSDLRVQFHAGVWLWRVRSSRRFRLQTRPVSGMDVPSAVLRTDRWTMHNILANMDYLCTTPGFWSGSAFRSLLICWIRAQVRGYILYLGSSH